MLFQPCREKKEKFVHCILQTSKRQYIHSLHMTDFSSIVMVVLVVGCGDGQDLRGHEHFVDVNCGRPGQ